MSEALLDARGIALGYPRGAGWQAVLGDFDLRLWQTVAAMVGLGMGVALIPETLCLAWRNEVRYLEIEPAGARSEIHAILPASEPSRAAQAFLATLKSGLDDA